MNDQPSGDAAPNELLLTVALIILVGLTVVLLANLIGALNVIG
jgi:hypothetical protein